MNPPRPAASDFDGDGFSDLVVKVPGEDAGDAVDAGAIHVIYGSPDGLSGTGDEVWHQDTPGVKGTVEEGDRFGTSVTAADFDLDGFDDLGIGAPFEDLGLKADAGVVHLLYGSRRGLTARGDQLWHQDRRGVKGVAEAGDRFGFAVECGYIDADPFDELMIEAPGEGVNAPGQGVVHLLFGSSGGVRARGDEVWHQDRRGIKAAGEAGDAFGSSIAIGNFDGDVEEDLAIGVPGENVGGVADAGAAAILRGGRGGVTRARDQLWHEDVSGVRGAPRSGGGFGAALAAGDFDGDGRDDLAIGVVGGEPHPGHVNVLYGTSRALSAAGDDRWTQASAGVKGHPEDGDRFGSALEAADFDGDGRDDLAIGIAENGAAPDSGAVVVLYGTSSGISAGGDQRWSQDSPGMKGTAEIGDRFGGGLKAGNFDGDGQWDLAITAPGEVVDGVAGAGVIGVVYGARRGLSAARDQLWRQGADGIKGVPESFDAFGSATVLPAP